MARRSLNGAHTTIAVECRLSRDRFLEVFAQRSPAMIVLEA